MNWTARNGVGIADWPEIALSGAPTSSVGGCDSPENTRRCAGWLNSDIRHSAHGVAGDLCILGWRLRMRAISI